MTRGFLDGAAEAEAFDQGQFVKVHQSTLLKADALADLMQLSADGTLKTDATLWDRIGPYPEAMVEYVKNHWLWGLLGLVLAFAALLTYGWKVMGWFG